VRLNKETFGIEQHVCLSYQSTLNKRPAFSIGVLEHQSHVVTLVQRSTEAPAPDIYRSLSQDQSENQRGRTSFVRYL
jgi:hypothetical protein